MSSVSQLSQSHMTQDQGQRSLSIPFVAILGAIVVIDNRLLSIRFRDQRRRNRQRNNFISTSIICCRLCMVLFLPGTIRYWSTAANCAATGCNNGGHSLERPWCSVDVVERDRF